MYYIKKMSFWLLKKLITITYCKNIIYCIKINLFLVFNKKYATLLAQNTKNNTIIYISKIDIKNKF